MENYNVVKSDFNEIADLPNPPKWNHNNCYFNNLLRFLPKHVGICLDIGCGKGELTALLARRAERITGIDLAENMIACAQKENSRPNITYLCANILETDFADESLDVIITTATAHHLPFEWLLDFAVQKLKQNGMLLILDLAEAETLSDKLLWGFAVIPNIWMNLIKNGRLRAEDAHSAAVWKRHGEHDTYLTVREIKRLTAKHLPRARIKRKLFWRYMLIWQKK